MVPTYQKGEVGLVIPLQLPLEENISGYTVTMYVRKPDGSTLTKSGTIVDSATGQVSWTTSGTDIGSVGEYIQQAKYVSGGTTKYGPMETFYVDDVLA